MAHEYWLVCPTHDLWRHRREVCTGRECVRCTLRYRRPPQPWRFTGYLERQLKHVDVFLAPSEFCRDKHYEFDFPHQMEVVPNFLADSEEPVAADQSPPHDRPYFLFVGRLKRIKGLDDVIPLFRDYRDADLLIAGDGDHAPALKELATGIPHVKFLGQLAREELNPYYRHAIALIMPTVSFETFGMTLIEAARQSTPIIARRMGAPAELVARCGGGRLFDRPGELLTAMEELQHDPGSRERLGRAAYDGFVKYWSESAVIALYLDVVRRAAEAKGLTRLAAATTRRSVPGAT
jgi:glycosyltransferase involved in cell wall biosynthesis